MSGGRYIHYGIKNEIKSFIEKLSPRPNELILDIHIDGVDIGPSTKVGLWTILCEFYFLLFLLAVSL